MAVASDYFPKISAQMIMANEHTSLPATPNSRGLDALTRTAASWEPGLVSLLENWTDNAKCYEWMHESAQSRYSAFNYVTMAIVGTVSAASGMSNTVVSAMSSSSGFSASWVFGILSVIQTFFMVAVNEVGFKRRAEAHGRFANDWRSLKLQLSTELMRPVASRADCTSFINIVRKRMEQISSESDAMIPPDIRVKCREKFSEIKGFDVPEICGDMEHTHAYNDSNGLSEPLIQSANIV